MDAYTNQLEAILLVSLRIAPTLGFAPPFTLLPAPATVRLLLGLALSLWLVAAFPAHTSARVAEIALVPAMITELLLGMALALSLQLAFAMILVAGRAIDIQAGFGLAQLADPTLRSQMPLVGTLLSYAAGAVFFATSGPRDLLAIWAQSVALVPVGGFSGRIDIGALASFMSGALALSIGLVGIVLLALFLVDMTIALVSRTLPQMNVLVIGFQAKTLTLLVTLPFVFGLSGALFLRLVRFAVEATPRLV